MLCAATRRTGSYAKGKFQPFKYTQVGKEGFAIARKIAVVGWKILKDLKPYNPALQIVCQPCGTGGESLPSETRNRIHSKL